YLIGTLFGEYDLVPGLTLRSSLAYTSNDFLEQQYTSQRLSAALGTGQANITNNTSTTWLSENTATLHRTLGRHDLTMLGGFTANNKWPLFPSGAVAWRASDEPFFRERVPAVSELKLRVSAGQTGSEAISPYQSLAAWSVGSTYALGLTTYRNGATISRNPNPNLRWETTTQYDAGL